MNYGVAFRHNYRSTRGLVLLLAPLLFGVRVCAQNAPSNAPAVKAQTPADAPGANLSPTQTPAKGADTKTEVSMQDTAPTFKLRVNLVQVRVVVRDAKGNPIRDLRRQDFLLYDQGK